MGLRQHSPLSNEIEADVTRIIGAAIEVHRRLGPGFVESIYRRALCIELDQLGVEFECEKEIFVAYRDVQIPGQRLDLLVKGQIIIELKVAEELLPLHTAQLISYLKTTNCRVGLLLNFNAYSMQAGIKRIVL